MHMTGKTDKLVSGMMEMKTAAGTARWGKSAERRYPRFKVEFKIRFFSTAAAGEGRAHDLSEGGIAIQVPAPVIEGEQIRLQFTPPYTECRFTVYAIVKHANADRCGMEFQKLTRRESDELGRVCRVLSAAQHQPIAD